MKYPVPSPARRAIALAASALLVAAPLSRPAFPKPDTAGAAPTISANYRITLNGFDIGTLRYTSAMEGNVYTLSSDVELTFLLGAFHWKGLTRTVGQASNSGPSPTGFNFDFTSTLKNGSVRMGFDRGSVKTIAIDPPVSDPADTVPLKPQHLKGVLDPLTAIMVLTRGGGDNPCAKKVAIFDGKQRFDLELAFRRREALSAGHDAVGTVCAIKYRPIAGYRATADTESLASNTGIEITFKSVPSADLQIPQRVVLPTLAGTAEITAERIDVRLPGQGQVALVD